MKNLIVLIMLILSVQLNAHADPNGDIYPVIKIEDNKFVLYYFNNENSISTKTYKFYKKIYSKKDQLLEKTQQIQAPINSLNYMFNLHSYVYNGQRKSFVRLLHNDSLYLFPYSIIPDQPYFCLKVTKISNIKNQKIIEKADKKILPSSNKIFNVYSGISSQEYFFITVTEDVEYSLEKLDTYPKVFVYAYKLENSKFDVPKKYKIGNPGRLVDTPVLSPLLYYKSKLFIAWVTNVGFGMYDFPFSKKTASLNLTCIDLNTQKIKTFKIKDKIHPNTALAMNIIDGMIMVSSL